MYDLNPPDKMTFPCSLKRHLVYECFHLSLLSLKHVVSNKCDKYVYLKLAAEHVVSEKNFNSEKHVFQRKVSKRKVFTFER